MRAQYRSPYHQCHHSVGLGRRGPQPFDDEQSYAAGQVRIGRDQPLCQCRPNLHVREEWEGGVVGKRARRHTAEVWQPERKVRCGRDDGHAEAAP